MKVIVLGGDGFCGWPTALHLSEMGHDILIIDDLSRRKIDIELECDSLTPIQPISERINAWKEITNRNIQFINLNVAVEYEKLLSVICDHKIEAIIHFAEQRAAPYSMKNSSTKRYTVDNNLNATNNVLCAIVESGLDVHLVHLGTMGVYGYSTVGMKIPEGYLTVKMCGDHIDIHDAGSDKTEIEREIIYPPDPGSIYHLTKTQDALFFYFYNKNNQIRITDLHQGVVWGTTTDQTQKDVRLINRFDYDSDYGTVLNRFLMQAALGIPLTVYGSGGQTRAFIHIRDTVKCIEIALNNPPEKTDRVKIFNQMTETHNVIGLAKKIGELTDSDIQHINNPRKEKSANDLDVDNKCFLELGLQPTTLSDGLLLEVSEIASKYADRCNQSKIMPSSKW